MPSLKVSLLLTSSWPSILDLASPKTPIVSEVTVWTNQITRTLFATSNKQTSVSYSLVFNQQGFGVCFFKVTNNDIVIWLVYNVISETKCLEKGIPPWIHVLNFLQIFPSDIPADIPADIQTYKRCIFRAWKLNDCNLKAIINYIEGMKREYYLYKSFV